MKPSHAQAVAALSVCLLLPALPARAQAEAYRYNAPAGWSVAPQAGGLAFTPPGERSDDVVLLLLPPQALAADFNGQFAVLRKATEQALGLGGAQEVQPARVLQDEGGLYAAWFALYTQVRAPAVAPVVLGLVARGAGGRFAGAIFRADSVERFRAYAPAAMQMMTGLRLAPGAAPAASLPAAAPAAAATAAGRAIPADPKALNVPLLAGVWAGNTTLRPTANTSVGHGGLTLKIRADGAYEYFHEFTDPGCTVTQTASGTLAVGGGELVMQPARAHERRVKHKDDTLCSSGENDLPLRPRRFKVEVSALNYRGHASYQMSIWSDTEITQSFLRTEPRPQAASLPRPAALAVANQLPPASMLGPWMSTINKPPGWTLDARQADGPYRADFELAEGGSYRLRVWRPDVLDSPLCTKNLELVEQGDVRISPLPPANASGQHTGTMVLQPRQSRLTEQIKRCGADDVKRTLELPAAPRWLLVQQVDGQPDKLRLVCDLSYAAAQYEYAAWAWLPCPENAEILADGYRRP